MSYCLRFRRTGQNIAFGRRSSPFVRPKIDKTPFNSIGSTEGHNSNNKQQQKRERDIRFHCVVVVVVVVWHKQHTEHSQTEMVTNEWELRARTKPIEDILHTAQVRIGFIHINIYAVQICVYGYTFRTVRGVGFVVANIRGAHPAHSI